LFPFSDQVLYPRTMGAHTALTRLALEPAPLAKLLAATVRIGAVRLVAIDRIRRVITRLHRNRVPDTGPKVALRVDVAHKGRSCHATLVGGSQADLAAAGAAGVARSLLEGEVVQAGAWMPEQVIAPGPFFARLAAKGLNAVLTDDPVTLAQPSLR
jgi:hypothetical protein